MCAIHFFFFSPLKHQTVFPPSHVTHHAQEEGELRRQTRYTLGIASYTDALIEVPPPLEVQGVDLRECETLDSQLNVGATRLDAIFAIDVSNCQDETGASQGGLKGWQLALCVIIPVVVVGTAIGVAGYMWRKKREEQAMKVLNNLQNRTQTL